VHALEREVDYLRVARRFWLGILRREYCRNEEERASEEREETGQR